MSNKNTKRPPLIIPALTKPAETIPSAAPVAPAAPVVIASIATAESEKQPVATFEKETPWAVANSSETGKAETQSPALHIEEFLSRGMSRTAQEEERKKVEEQERKIRLLEEAGQRESFQPTVLRLSHDAYRLESAIFPKCSYKSRQQMRHDEYIKGLMRLAAEHGISTEGLDLKSPNKRINK